MYRPNVVGPYTYQSIATPHAIHCTLYIYCHQMRFE